MKLFRILALSFLTLLTLPICAENGMNSPYTRYGFGQLSAMETGTNKGMGGTGIGVQNSNQINMLNPASYAAVDTLTFLLDIGMSLSNSNLAEGSMKRNALNTTFDYLAMQFRLVPRLGMTIGLMPFSNIGYSFKNSTTIDYSEDEKITATNIFQGDGGLRQVTAGLGYTPFKGLSVGANLSYIYGEIYHYIYNQYSDANINTQTRQYLADITTYNAEFGIQYQAAIGKNRFVIGATYRPGHSIDDETYTINISSGNDTISCGHMSLPSEYGAGISYTYDNRLTIAADYSMQQYSTVSFFGDKGVDRCRASIGMEYVPEHISRKLFRRTRYRAGLHYATAHYTVDGKKGPTEYGAIIGIGLPIMNRWNGKSLVNISGQAIHVRPNAPGMITENQLRLNIGLSFNETWFNKWKVQ